MPQAEHVNGRGQGTGDAGCSPSVTYGNQNISRHADREGDSNGKARNPGSLGSSASDRSLSRRPGARCGRNGCHSEWCRAWSNRRRLTGRGHLKQLSQCGQCHRNIARQNRLAQTGFTGNKAPRRARSVGHGEFRQCVRGDGRAHLQIEQRRVHQRDWGIDPGTECALREELPVCTMIGIILPS